MSDGTVPPGHDLGTVERAILELTAELYPAHPPARELLLELVTDPDDEREAQTARQAIGNLRELGILRERDDDVLELTPATRRTVALLTGL